MAKLEQFFDLTVKQRQNRYFSEEFKKRKVKELEQHLVKISDIAKEYQVCRQTVYKWIYKYSAMRKKEEKLVYESSSDTLKMNQLQNRIKELERIVGQKQMQIDFRDKVIELAEETYKVDIKKKFGARASSGTGATGENIPTE